MYQYCIETDVRALLPAEAENFKPKLEDYERSVTPVANHANLSQVAQNQMYVLR
jgi:hypothetical protein